MERPQGGVGLRAELEQRPGADGRVRSSCVRAHGIEMHATDRDQTLTGVIDYESGEAVDVELPTGSLVIKAGQPMGRLARALFERDPVVTGHRHV